MIEKILEEKKLYSEKSEVLYSLESKKKYEGLELVEIHCIDSIKKLEKPNVTNIAINMKMTKSGITKVTTKLVNKGFLEKYKLENNKKEVYFSLTNRGKKVYEIHDERHSGIKRRDVDFLKGFTEDELITIAKFLEKNNELLDKEIDRVEKEIESKVVK